MGGIHLVGRDFVGRHRGGEPRSPACGGGQGGGRRHGVSVQGVRPLGQHIAFARREAGQHCAGIVLGGSREGLEPITFPPGGLAGSRVDRDQRALNAAHVDVAVVDQWGRDHVVERLAGWRPAGGPVGPGDEAGVDIDRAERPAVEIDRQ